MTALAKAMRAFVAAKCDRSAMNVTAWSETYRVGAESVRAAWEAAMSEASMKPLNCFDEGGEGK